MGHWGRLSWLGPASPSQTQSDGAGLIEENRKKGSDQRAAFPAHMGRETFPAYSLGFPSLAVTSGLSCTSSL